MSISSTRRFVASHVTRVYTQCCSRLLRETTTSDPIFHYSVYQHQYTISLLRHLHTIRVAMICSPISSPIYAFGRTSSPLNPHTDRSSSPPSLSSAGDYYRPRNYRNPSSPTPMMQQKTRYKRPDQKKYLSSAPAELFAEASTPTEALMWREKYNRRVEKQRQSREHAVDQRRGGLDVFEEEDEAKARSDDEEVCSNRSTA